jgi:hypothetical protein
MQQRTVFTYRKNIISLTILSKVSKIEKYILTVPLNYNKKGSFHLLSIVHVCQYCKFFAVLQKIFQGCAIFSLKSFF